MVPVCKNALGNVIATHKEMARVAEYGPLGYMENQHRANGHAIIWGPLCRNLKRIPKGKEKVSIICKTCGHYIEMV